MMAEFERFQNMEPAELVDLANGGDPAAMCFLGITLSEMDEPQKAVMYVEAAAEKEYPSAEYQLGVWYTLGKNVESDNKKALAYFRRAAEHGDPAGMTQLGLAYARGAGVEMNAALALEWLQKGAAHGDTDTMVLLGRMYENGNIAAKDPVKAFEWYRKAEELDNVEGRFCMGRCMFYGIGTGRSVYDGMTMMLRAACTGKYPDGELEVAIMLRRGIPELEQDPDPESASIYFRNAAGHGLTEAMFQLAEMHILGEFGNKSDLGEATKYLRMGAEGGDPRCMMILGTVLEADPTANNLKEAFGYYEKAAEDGVSAAYYKLAEAYFHGRGTDVQKGKAMIQYLKSLYDDVKTDECLKALRWYLSNENTPAVSDVTKEKSAETIEDILGHREDLPGKLQLYAMLSDYYFHSAKPDDLRKAADYQRLANGGKVKPQAPSPASGSQKKGSFLGRLKNLFGG